MAETKEIMGGSDEKLFWVALMKKVLGGNNEKGSGWQW